MKNFFKIKKMEKSNKRIIKRCKTPSVLQMEAVECGAAALAIILSYFGKLVTLEQIRMDCGVSRDGSKASNILKVARKYGLEADGYKKEPVDLLDLPFPMIIHWNFNHFLVLEGIKKNKVFLNDPAVGHRTVSFEEFDKSFTGIALVFNKTSDFKKGGKKQSIIDSLKSRLSHHKTALAYIVLTGLCLVVPGLVVPTFTKIFIDDFLVQNMNTFIQPLLIGMFITSVIRMALTGLSQHYLLRMETKIALYESSKFFLHIFRLPIQFFAQRFAGEISSRLEINDKVAKILSGELASTLVSLFMVIFFAVLLFYYDKTLAIIGILIAFLNILVLRFVSYKRIALSQNMIQDHGKMIGISMGGLQSIETLKATGMETDFFNKWSGYQAKKVNSVQEFSSITILLSIVPVFLSSLNNIVILGFGAFKVMQGEMTMGLLVAFQSLMSNFIAPFNQIVNLGGTIQELVGDMKRLDDVFKYEIDASVRNNNKLINIEENMDGCDVKLRGSIELKNLSFGFSPLDPPLIKDFSLLLKPGDRVAIVGQSGCGKSTIIKLISGLYKSWSGEILFDNTPIEKYPRYIINNSVAAVDQDIFLFEGSIRDNITLWDHAIPEENIILAAKDACIHDDISERGGYDSKMEENGSNFSGGQRQRIEIARALVNNPSILILDEATSALDPKTEKMIEDNLKQRGCTCIIVAHRLSAIRDCDEIIVLEHGKITQRGIHDDLKNLEGIYSQLIQMQ